MFNKPRLLTPGPTPLPERVRLALAQDMIHHRKPGFKKILLETETMLQKLFGTEQPVLPLSCSGTEMCIRDSPNPLLSPKAFGLIESLFPVFRKVKAGGADRVRKNILRANQF